MAACQGNKGPVIIEKECPNCGSLIEMMSTDPSAKCESCGFTIWGDMMDCVYSCPRARDCLSKEQYERLNAKKEEWIRAMSEQLDGDEW